MILVSISRNWIMRRYDTSRPEGLTHIARIDNPEEGGLEECVGSFRVHPPWRLAQPADPFFWRDLNG